MLISGLKGLKIKGTLTKKTQKHVSLSPETKGAVNQVMREKIGSTRDSKKVYSDV